MIKELAPIALFVYSRPWHTERTLEALSNNELAAESELYVFSDGPKANSDDRILESIASVRKIVKSKRWCREVHLIERESNYGLADSIISGVSEVFSKHSKVIVLEDDLETSKGFLKFMNEALELYAEDKEVMHISGYMFPVNGKLPETFFYKQASCWGWATWQNAWSSIETDPKKLFQALQDTGEIASADIDGTNQFLIQLKGNLEGIIKTWAVKWHFSIILRKGLCLHPGRSLVRNIGLDGSGENSGVKDTFDNGLVDYVNVVRVPIKDYVKVYPLLREYYRRKEGPLVILKRQIFRLLPVKLRNLIIWAAKPNVRRSIREINRLSSLERYTPTETEFLGKKIAIIDSASFLFTRNEIFNEHIYRFPALNNQPYVVDCGANIGLSVIYFKTLFPNARVVAFEPDKKVFEVLKYNIESFAFANVKLINKGLWHEATTLPFFEEGADGGRIARSKDRKNIRVIETMSLREFLTSRVDFLKIDIEGAELTVLKDCEDLLPNVNNLFVEYHSFIGEIQKLDELLCILRNAGFRYSIQQHGVISKQPFMGIQQQNGMDILLNISAFRLA